MEEEDVRLKREERCLNGLLESRITSTSAFTAL